MDNASDSLKRGLKARHLTMISLGGSIGTGLFLASGSAVHDAGPGGALLAYALIGCMVYFLMTSLGELASYMPVSGSFSTYAGRFVDPALGFALGWNYWYNWAVTVAAELSAGIMLMKYWFPDSSSVAWCALFLSLILIVNVISVRSFGETEYWLSFLKVATVIVFIGLGLLIALGEIGGGVSTVMRRGESAFHGGLLATVGVFMVAGFSFQGTELIGVAAGESEDPAKNIPKAVRQVFWRILLFYILALLVIGLLIPYNDPRLTSGNVMQSPFTLVFEQFGLPFAASVMNAIILTAVLSAGNSGLYASTRMLWVLAREGKAPRLFGVVNSRGIPVYALLVTAATGLLAFLTSIFGEGVVYTWLLNASGLSGFLAWLGIAVSHYRFRRACYVQGKDISKLPYRAKWFPFGPIFAVVVCLVVIVGQNLSLFRGGPPDWYGILVSYIGLPLFIVFWLGYKLTRRTRVIPLKDCKLE